MSDSNERQRLERPIGFTELTEFAQRGSALATPERIRGLAMRRLHRRRAGQAVVGTGALAAVVFLGAGLVHNGSGNTARVVVPAAGVSAPPSPSNSHKPVKYMFPSSLPAESASAVEDPLHEKGYSVTLKQVASDTVPAGDAIDIEDGQGHSLLGRVVAIGTPLVLVVSAGPSH